MKCQTNHPDGIKDKLKFDTLDDAIEHAKWVNSKEDILQKVVAYKCNLCFKYHVGRNGRNISDKQKKKLKNYFNI